jgi:dTDP-4-amino-4,6-dideoxygalactose transaminase
LPAYSPVSPAALGAGAWSVLTGGGAARRAVQAGLEAAAPGKRVLLTDSGTTALALALGAVSRAAGGRPVALPAYGCYDLATAADAAEVGVVLYDLDPLTLGPEWGSLRQAVAAGVSGVVVVHLYGVPVELSRVRALCRGVGIPVIEDAAQAAGALVEGRLPGTLGEYGVLSFGRGKGVTGGAGGALLYDPGAPGAGAIPAALPAGRGLGSLLALLAQWALGRPALYGLPARLPFLGLGDTVYRRPRAARGLLASAAGVLEQGLGVVEREAEVRRAHAAALLEVVARHPGCGLTPVRPPAGSVPGYLRLPVLLDAARRCEAGSRGGEARRLGIMPGYPGTLAELAGFRGRCQGLGGYPGAEALRDSLWTLPVHSRMRAEDLAEVGRWVGEGGEEPWVNRKGRRAKGSGFGAEGIRLR